jgi:hypothetical protein
MKVAVRNNPDTGDVIRYNMEETVWVKTKMGGLNVHRMFKDAAEAAAEGYAFYFTEGPYDYFKRPLTEDEEVRGWFGPAKIAGHALYGRAARED